MLKVAFETGLYPAKAKEKNLYTRSQESLKVNPQLQLTLQISREETDNWNEQEERKVVNHIVVPSSHHQERPDLKRKEEEK